MNSFDINSTCFLKSGEKIPVLGFGVWDSPPHLTVQSCLEALKTGYRHIDTSELYGNESEVGEAVRTSELNREDVFITSKIFKPGVDATATYQKCLEGIEKCDRADGYLDLLLIHNGTAAGPESLKMMWQAMEKLYEEGKCMSIGVSNTGIGLIEGMKQYARVWPPHVNQLELHPWCQQRKLVEFCHQNGIVVQAYCPLVRNKKVDDPTLKSIAERHGKLTTQVLLRYSLQKGWVPLPKSDNPERIRANADLYDFALSNDDVAELDAQDQGAKGALVMVADD